MRRKQTSSDEPQNMVHFERGRWGFSLTTWFFTCKGTTCLPSSPTSIRHLMEWRVTQREFQIQFSVFLTFLNYEKLAPFDSRFSVNSAGAWFKQFIILRKLCSITVHKNRLSGCQNLSLQTLLWVFLLSPLNIAPDQELFSGIWV